MAIFGRSLEIICVLFSENLGNSKAIGSPRSATSVAPPPEQVKAAHFLPRGIPEIQINFKVSMSSDGVVTVIMPKRSKRALYASFEPANDPV